MNFVASWCLHRLQCKKVVAQGHGGVQVWRDVVLGVEAQNAVMRER